MIKSKFDDRDRRSRLERQKLVSDLELLVLTTTGKRINIPRGLASRDIESIIECIQKEADKANQGPTLKAKAFAD